MKKNISKILALALGAVLVTTSLGACSKKEEKQEETDARIITTQLLNNFSNEKELYQVILSNGYGKMSLNKDKAYYTTGNGSAALWVADNNGAPMLFRQRLESDVLGYDYTDFTKIKEIRTSVYNASEEEVQVMFALEFSDGSKSSMKKYTLQSGWNSLHYDVDREMLSMQFDISKTMYLGYTFTPNETPYTVYVDDISLGMTTSAMKEVIQTIEKDEICSFDKNYQMSVFSLHCYSTIRMAYFADFGLTANPDRVKSGKSFYVTTKAGMEEKGNWYWMKLNSKYSQKIDWKSLTEEDVISFWVYNEGPLASLAFSVSTNKGKTVQVSLNNGKMKANSWAEMKVKVSDIKVAADAAKQLEKDEKIGDILTGINVGWGPFDDVAQKTFYFDEFKIERGGAKA